MGTSSLYNCVTNAQSSVQDHTKTAVPKNPTNSGSTPTPRLHMAVLAQGRGGGGGGLLQQAASTNRLHAELQFLAMHVWNQKICVPKIARINVSFCKFSFLPL